MTTIYFNLLIIVVEAHLPENLCYEAHNHFHLDLQSSLNDIKDKLIANKEVNTKVTEKNIVPLFSCAFCDLEFMSDEILKQHHSSVHETSL